MQLARLPTIPACRMAPCCRSTQAHQQLILNFPVQLHHNSNAYVHVQLCLQAAATHCPPNNGLHPPDGDREPNQTIPLYCYSTSKRHKTTTQKGLTTLHGRRASQERRHQPRAASDVVHAARCLVLGAAVGLELLLWGRRDRACGDRETVRDSSIKGSGLASWQLTLAAACNARAGGRTST